MHGNPKFILLITNSISKIIFSKKYKSIQLFKTKNWKIITNIIRLHICISWHYNYCYKVFSSYENGMYNVTYNETFDIIFIVNGLSIFYTIKQNINGFVL